MSFNHTLVDDNEKGWCNMFVNNMKIYNDLEVNGSIINAGSISGGVTHEDDVLIKGKLTLDNSNNSANEAIEITGNGEILTDGDVVCRDVQSTGSIQTTSLLFDLNGSELQQYEYHDNIVTFNAFDNPLASDVDITYSASIIGSDGNDAIVNVIFNFNGSEFEENGSGGVLNSTPIASEFRPLAGNTLKQLCIVNDQTGRHLALAELKSDGELYIYNDIDESNYPIQPANTIIGPISDISFTFTRRS